VSPIFVDNNNEHTHIGEKKKEKKKKEGLSMGATSRQKEE
jgi:hypothetical protein